MKNKKLEHNDSHGFKVPDAYFESFDAKLLSKLSKPKLEDHLDPGFKTPEGYFDNLEQSIMSKVDSKTKVISLKQITKLYYFAGIAASALLLFGIFMNNESSDEISAEMVEAYFENSDLNSYELAELLSEADILEEDFVIIETEYNEEHLESYLLENADIEQLLQ